jgi:hypothetical protein
MSEMKPLSKVTPSKEMTPEREACTKAIALACRYSERPGSCGGDGGVRLLATRQEESSVSH